MASVAFVFKQVHSDCWVLFITIVLTKTNILIEI